ncbi:hypothetical protein H6F86_14840 [Phormidium sp. FACHB-592]|uniref:Uncharacterized protein n=1 Tax=Stenomitos frigidus AS-A4 TaxID=2933935 RepID=A0ABV0KUB5_9CYAN|nr:hypothetical protein [Phormidium sp. FACHB-592]MBD2075148.1 hypothetical protein [Phormidium sp. FACHB-592]
MTFCDQFFGAGLLAVVPRSSQSFKDGFPSLRGQGAAASAKISTLKLMESLCPTAQNGSTPTLSSQSFGRNFFGDGRRGSTDAAIGFSTWKTLVLIQRAG